MINARISWEAERFQAYTGHILGEAKGYEAKTRIFGISYSANRADKQAGTPWLLAHRLPFRGIERKFATLKGAQEHAERYLVYAFELMGFQDPHATLTEAARRQREALSANPEIGTIELIDVIDPEAKL